jgi:uncharacterized protein (DUF302 family)
VINDSVWVSGAMILTREKPKSDEKIPCTIAIYHHKSNKVWTGIEPEIPR